MCQGDAGFWGASENYKSPGALLRGPDPQPRHSVCVLVGGGVGQVIHQDSSCTQTAESTQINRRTGAARPQGVWGMQRHSAAAVYPWRIPSVN